MSYNIGPKIGIDGEKEFRDSIRKINDTYKALEAETKAVTAAFDAQGDEQGKLEATSKQLQKQIDNQKSKMALLEDAVKKASDKFGENSIEATRLRGALFDTQATVAKLEAELRGASSQLNSAGEALDDFADGAESAGDATLGFGDILKANLTSDAILGALKNVGEAVKDIAKEAVESAADIRAVSAQFEQAFGDMEDTAEDALDAISDETAIAATRMQKSYTKIFAFTKSVGADSEEALDIASRALRAAADSAAYYDRSVEEVTETLQSFLKGNYANDAALGIAATETVRNAKANELYAKSFQELSESQKVDVLLSMVEAGNAASGALGQAAREADSWTNVNGELSESWRQFLGVIGDPVLEAAIPVIQGATTALKNLTDELTAKTDAEILASSMKDFVTSMESANATFETAEKNIAAAAYEADYYAGRLAELEAAGLDTAETQQEYAIVVDRLNELIPELNLSIDEQTGLVNQNTDAIKRDIEAWKQDATAKALQEKFSSALEAQGKANADLIESQAKLNLLKDEATEKERQYAAALTARSLAEEALTEVTAEYNAVSTRGDEIQLEAFARMEAAQKKVNELTAEVASLSAEIDNNFYAQQALSGEIDDAKETLASYDDQLQTANESVNLFRKETDELSDAETKHEANLQATRHAIESLEQAYADAKAESLDSINAQIGLFDKLAESSDYSAASIIANWEAQRRAFESYSDNLQKAVDMGLDEALVQQLSDGSQQSMQILDALVNDTEISIDEINAAFGDLSEGKDKLASTMGAMKAVADEQFSAIVSLAKNSGMNMIDGLISGANSRAGAFEMSLAGISLRGLNSFNETLDINSPARKMIPSGEFTVDGAIEGVENRTAAFERAMSDLALAGENSFLSAQLDRVGAYPSVVQAPGSSSRTVSHNYGGVHFDIYQQPGESGDDLAHRVMEIIQHEVEVKEAGFGV